MREFQVAALEGGKTGRKMGLPTMNQEGRWLGWKAEGEERGILLSQMVPEK